MSGPDRDPEGGHERSADTWSELSGSAGDVVQARDITGGVHFHQARGRDSRPPRMLPGDVRGFVNRVNELRRLDQALAVESADANAFPIEGSVTTALSRYGHRTE